MGKNDSKPAEVPPVADAPSKPTPDNTPLPGGGRYRWDDALPGWVDQDASPGKAQA